MAGVTAPPGAAAETVSWVQCDKCSKWRKISSELADGLSDEVPWYCSDNPDPAHNACDTPQELTDAEIDRLHAEENGKAEDEAGRPRNGTAAAAAAAGAVPRKHRRPPVWQLITSNLYTHRERKEQDEDDIMICQCKKVWATDTVTAGCGPECLNRMLNIECVQEYCPSGHRCSNQMFTKKEYAKLEVHRAGAKGFGLFARQDLKAGDFIIEYLGEVLEEEEYHRRKEYFAETGQRHYYFMNIGNGEVIDASRRGNLGRFINHSCEPNCETQKWVVHGELAIGLFTLEDIPKGTELTFDYNFERYGDKPMKCLCGSKNCRGVIGGSQDKEGSAATRAAIEAAVEPALLEEDPEFIMVTEKERDAALLDILDRVVGLGWDKGWTPKLSTRLTKLASQHGVDLANLSEDDDEEGAAMPAAASSGMSEEEDAVPAPKPAARKPAAKKGSGKQRQKAAAGKGKKPGRQRKTTVESDDDEWVAEQDDLSEESSKDELPGGAAGEAGGAQRSAGGSSSDGEEDGEEELATLRRAGAGVAASARAAGLAAAGAQELPFRKRLKRFARAAVEAEAAATTPAGSSGSRPRLGSAGKAGPTQSVASSTPGSAGPLIPKRSNAGLVSASYERGSLPKRRSEIDRRLDEVVNSAGRIRETHPDVIIRVLRLFNLCEIGPTVSKMGSGDLDEMGMPARPPSAGPQRSDGSGASVQRTGSASDLRALRPLSRNESGSSLGQAAAAAALQAAAAAALQHHGAVVGGGAAAADGGREDGEVTPEPEASAVEPRASQQHHHLQPPGQPGGQQLLGSPGKDREQRGGRDRAAEVSSRIRAAWNEAQRSGQLSARQSARIADMSLLLDVVLKTNTLSAKKDFVKCGLLRQLLGVVGGNTGKQYGAILKKVLRVVESLPLTADDIHHTRSAHGSFADMMREMAQSTDFEIRQKAYGLLKKFPVQSCTRPLPQEAMHPGTRRGSLTPGSMGGLPPPPSQQWRDGPPPSLVAPPPPGPSPYGGPPPPGMFGSPHQQQHDGWRQRDPMPPSRFGPGRPPPGGPHGPAWQGPGPGQHMGRPPHMPPPHGHQQQHSGMPRPPPPPPLAPPGLGISPAPPANGATPGAAPSSSSRKRSRWDQPAPGKGDAPGDAAADAPTPGTGQDGRHGSGYGSGWPRPSSGQGLSPAAAGQEEPPSKRQAGGADGGANGVHAGLDPAPSWDVETQFALGTAGASYLAGGGAAGAGSNMSPDAGAARGGGQTYSPLASPTVGQQQPAAGRERTTSAAYSFGSAGQAAVPPPPGVGPAGNGMHLSPMSDDDAAAQPLVAEQPGAAYEREEQPGQQEQAMVDAPDAWDSPDASFSMYVADMVRRRVGKYAQPDHPMRVSQEEARELYTKIRREIVAKEQQAYDERQVAGLFKPIERGKLEAKIRDFVRDSIRRYHERRGL